MQRRSFSRSISRISFLVLAIAVPASAQSVRIQEFDVPDGAHPHDVSPAPDGKVWYTAQFQSALGVLDPETGETRHIFLGEGSRPHGVITGPGGNAWITDGGLNAIVRVDAETDQVDVFPLPDGFEDANLNTAVFDKNDVLWFTGQEGVYGRIDPDIGVVEAWEAPRGRGPYGITTTSDGSVYYASLAGSYVGLIAPNGTTAVVLEPPTEGQGTRRVWADSEGRIWASQWNSGNVAVYDPAAKTWKEWKLPGENPRAYAVYVDENDDVWLSDFAANTIVRFDPETETFDTFEIPSPGANVRQIHGRPGEVWGAESGTDKLILLRTGPSAGTN